MSIDRKDVLVYIGNLRSQANKDEENEILDKLEDAYAKTEEVKPGGVRFLDTDDYSGVDFWCGKCKSYIFGRDYRYCCDCGQKIDWSTIDEDLLTLEEWIGAE